MQARNLFRIAVRGYHNLRPFWLLQSEYLFVRHEKISVDFGIYTVLQTKPTILPKANYPGCMGRDTGDAQDAQGWAMFDPTKWRSVPLQKNKLGSIVIIIINGMVQGRRQWGMESNDAYIGYNPVKCLHTFIIMSLDL